MAGGTQSVDAALEELRHLPYEDLGFAKIDHHRGLRDALPEVVLAQGKTPAQIAAIGEQLAEQSGRLLVTRLDREAFAPSSAVVAGRRIPRARARRAVSTACPAAVCPASASSAPAPRTCRCRRRGRAHGAHDGQRGRR